MARCTLGVKILIGVGIIILIVLIGIGLLLGFITGVFNIQKTLSFNNNDKPVDHPVKVLFVAYPESIYESEAIFERRNACTFKDCLNFSVIVDTDFNTYRYAFDEDYSGGKTLVSPNQEHAFLPMDRNPRHFYRGAITPFETDERWLRSGFAFLSDDGTLLRHSIGTRVVDDEPPRIKFITDTSMETKPFKYAGVFQECDGRVFYFGSKVEGETIEATIWHEFEAHLETRTFTPLNRFNELRPEEQVFHHQCLRDGRGTIEIVTKHVDQYGLLTWDPDQGARPEEGYVESSLFDPDLAHVTMDHLILINEEGEYELFDRHTQQSIHTGKITEWDSRIDPIRSIVRFYGDRAFVLAKYDTKPEDKYHTLAWMGLEVNPITGNVLQRVHLPSFEEAYPGNLTLEDLVITDGDAFSSWLKTQPTFTP